MEGATLFIVPNYDPRDDVNRFSFEVPRRHWWHFRTKFSLPFLQYVPLAVMRKAKADDKPLQLQEVAKLIGERAAARAIDRLNLNEIGALEKAWLEASAVGLGELAASTH